MYWCAYSKNGFHELRRLQAPESVEHRPQIAGQNNSEQTPTVDAWHTKAQPALRQGSKHDIGGNGCNKGGLAYAEITNPPLCILSIDFKETFDNISLT